MEPLLTITHVSHSFMGRGRLLPQETNLVLRDVNFALYKGETLGFVGESGSGKSTIGRIAVGLLEPTKGNVQIFGQSLYNKKEHTNYKAFRHNICRHVQMIFQDPYSSLNPRMRICTSVEEPLLCGGYNLTFAQRKQKALNMLERVGISKEQALRYPHEFSGGQRQRIAIARALVGEPDFVVCDEPTSSLDASVQAQILNLLVDLQAELFLTYLFISHDLAVVQHMSDRVAVMQAGEIVETATTQNLFCAPQHGYTKALLNTVPEA